MQTMIYNDKGEYAVVADADVPAFLAGGWSATPTVDVHTEPKKYPGEPTPPRPKTPTKPKE